MFPSRAKSKFANTREHRSDAPPAQIGIAPDDVSRFASGRHPSWHNPDLDNGGASDPCSLVAKYTISLFANLIVSCSEMLYLDFFAP